MLVLMPTAIPSGAVNQKVGHTDRKHLRLLFRLVVVGDEIQPSYPDPLNRLPLQTSPAGPPYNAWRRAVALDGTKVAVAVHQGHSLLKILGHDHQGLIDGAVAVGMVLTHGIAHDTRRFLWGLSWFRPELAHVI